MSQTNYLTGNELKAVLKYLSQNLDDDMNVLLSLSLRTGARSEEIAMMTPDSVDVRTALVKVAPCKNSRYREIPIKRILVPHVVRAIGNMSDIHRATLKRRMRRAWKELLFKALGYGYEGISLHGARSTAAINLYAKTKDILLVQKFLGHKALSSTMIYVDIEHMAGREEEILKAIG